MANSESMTLTTDDGEEITVTVIKFESVHAFELFAKMDGAQNGAMLMAFRRDILGCTYVTRLVNGERSKIDFNGVHGKLLDEAMNKAFRGTGIDGLFAAMKFAQEVNYKRFLDAQRAAQQAKRAEQKQSEASTDPEVLS